MIGSLDMRERAAVLSGSIIFTLVLLVLLSKQFLEISTFEVFGDLKYCNFKPTANISSTENDAVFISTTLFNHKMELLIRSLRSTGCKAKILIFTPEGVHIPLNIFSSGVTQIISSPVTARAQHAPEKARWEWYYLFLTENKMKFDRIIHVDATDSFFFGDPFAAIEPKDKLYIIEDDKKIIDDSRITGMINRCHMRVSKTILESKLLSNSMIGGGFQPFYSFVKALVTHNEWSLCWSNGNDQGDINYVVWKNNNKNFDFDLVLLNCSSRFSLINSCIDRPNLWNIDKQPVGKESNGTLLFINRLHKAPELVDVIKTKCPRNENVRIA